MSGYYFFIIVLVAGLLAGLEPMTVSIFAALVAGSKGKGHAKNRQLLVSLTFIKSYAVLIGLLSLALVGIFSSAPYELFVSIALAIATVSVVWGLLRIKNYFWYAPFGEMPNSLKRLLHKNTVKTNSPSSAILLALSASAATLINTLVFIGSFATLIVLLRPGEFAWIILIALSLTAPLIIFYWQIHRGLKISALIKWKEDNKKMLELGLGLLSIFLGWLIYLTLNGTIISL